MTKLNFFKKSNATEGKNIRAYITAGLEWHMSHDKEPDEVVSAIIFNGCFNSGVFVKGIG